MTRVIGRLSAVGIAKETVRGTAEAAPTYFVPIQSLDFDDKVETIENDSAFGRIEELNDSQVAKRHAEGNYEGKVFADSIGVELVALFGQSPTSVQKSTTGVYDHTFAVKNTNEHASLSLFYKDANQDVKYALAMLDSFELKADLDKFLTRSASFMSKASDASTTTVVHTSEAEFLARHLSFKEAADTTALDAASAIAITNFTLTVSKNVEIQYVFGADTIATNSSKIDNIVNQQFGVEGSFEAYRDDLTQHDLVMNGTKKAIRFEAINTDVNIGTGTDHPAIRFDLAKVAFTEQSRAWDSNSTMKQTISFKGLFDLTTTSLLAARLTNTIVSY